MKWLSLTFALLLASAMLYAQEEGGFGESVPYLSPSDITAIESTFLDDVPQGPEEVIQEMAVESPPAVAEEPATAQEEVVEASTETSEITVVSNNSAASQKMYYLLILDRIFSTRNADIGCRDGMNILYQYQHGRNGYLIVLYTSEEEGLVFPEFPNGSRIMVNMATIRRRTINDYINSNAFRRFVTNQGITTGLLRTLQAN